MTDLFLITSVINTGKQPWSYTEKRSVFTTEERYKQTLQTIDSIRNQMPSSKILLVECSELSQEYTRNLLNKVDYFLNLYEYNVVREACLETNKKGYGEAMQTKFAIEYILRHTLEFKRFFKISGRYYLNENFNQQNYAENAFTFKKGVSGCDNNLSISTVLFSVPYSYFLKFYDTVCSVVEYYATHGPRGYEELLPIHCTPRNELDILGVAGYVAVGDGVHFTG